MVKNSINPVAYVHAVNKGEIDVSKISELEQVALSNHYQLVKTIGPYRLHPSQGVRYVGTYGERDDPIVFEKLGEIKQPIVVTDSKTITGKRLTSLLLDSSYKNPPMPPEFTIENTVFPVNCLRDFYFDVYKQKSQPEETLQNLASIMPAVKEFKQLPPRPNNALDVLGSCGPMTHKFIGFCRDNFGITNVKAVGYLDGDSRDDTPSFPTGHHEFALHNDVVIDWTADQFGRQAMYPVIFRLSKSSLMKLKKESPRQVYGF
jgi:hypothetical protein